MAKKKSSVSMDEKSANAGDRMKHAVSLEVLARTSHWSKVTCSETHAGAGVYLEKHQPASPAAAHIRNLREQVLWQLVCRTMGGKGSVRADEAALPGVLYLDLLRDWWFRPERLGSYPGGAKQAAEYLMQSSRSFEMRLTEADEECFKRLKKSLTGIKHETKNESFDTNLDWLAEPDQLYLVVDPFRCVDAIGSYAENFGIVKGDIDHDTVRDILGRCDQKKATVIQFWWAERSQDKTVDSILIESHSKTCELFTKWSWERPERAYCQFHDRHNHASALLGIGDGAAIVSNIAGVGWDKSWLRAYVVVNGDETPTENGEEV